MFWKVQKIIKNVKFIKLELMLYDYYEKAIFWYRVILKKVWL